MHKRILRVSVLLAVLVLPVASAAHSGSPPVVLKKGNGRYPIGQFLELYEDQGATLTIHDVTSDSISPRFVHNPSAAPNLGVIHAVVWVRFSVLDSTDGSDHWLLEIAHPPLNHVDLYVPQEDGTYLVKLGGNTQPFLDRDIKHRNHIYRLPTVLGKPVTYYLRCASASSILLPLTIYSQAAFAQSDHTEQLTFGLYHGIILAMILYNMFLFFSVQDKSYLFYSLYVLGYGFYQLVMDGIALEYVWPRATQWNIDSIPFVVGWFEFFGAVFARHFLATKRDLPAWDKTLLALMVIGVLLASTAFYLPLAVTNWLSIVSGFVFVTILLATGALAMKRGIRHARFFLLALSGMWAGFLIRIFRILDVLPYAAYTTYGFQVGVLWEVMFLSFALGDRINTLKVEKEREKALMRNRIAADLHDEIGSNLSGIAMASQILKRKGQLDDWSREELTDIAATAIRTADMMRDIVWFINPEHDTLDDLVMKMKEAAGLLLNGMEYEVVGFEKLKRRLTPEVRRNIYLIYKEALNNIAKHARAQRVQVRAREGDGRLNLEIHDDGVGFFEGEVRQSEGLKNMRRRAAHIGGTLAIMSGAGKGTTITLSVPLVEN